MTSYYGLFEYLAFTDSYSAKKLIGPGPRENESMGYCPVQRILTIDDSPLGHLKELDNIFYMMWQFYDCNGNPG